MKLLPTTKASRNINVGAALFQVAFAILLVAVGVRPYVQPGFFVFHAAMAAYAQKEIRRGHREAGGDRGNQGANSAGGSVDITITGSAAGARSAFAAFAGALGSSPRTRVDDLPVRQSDEPIRAWKQARIILRGGVPTFAGIGGHDYGYKADDIARCGQNRIAVLWTYDTKVPRHEYGPRLDCSCGFYALKESVRPTEGIVLEVELYGTVIVCERGYRAERQRVLGVTLPAKCSNALCNNPATLVTFIEETLCGLCDAHAALADRFPLLTPAPAADLAGILGTEVRFALAPSDSRGSARPAPMSDTGEGTSE